MIGVGPRKARPLLQQRRPLLVILALSTRGQEAPDGNQHRSLRHDHVKADSWQRANRDEFQRATLHGVDKQLYCTAFDNLVDQASSAPGEKQQAARVVKDVVATLQRMPALKGSHVCVGGSYGRGTNVCNNFDVDLIFFLKEYDGLQLCYPNDWESTELLRQKILPEVAQWLVEQRSDIKVEDGINRDVLQLTVGGVQSDLLILPTCVQGKVTDHARQQRDALMVPLYEQLRSTPESASYASLRERAVSEALKVYVQRLGDNVKGVVRMLKAWHKLGGGAPPLQRIPSVVLEVLVLAAWQRLREKLPFRRQHFAKEVTFPKAELFREALLILHKAVTDEYVVMVDAGDWGYDRELGMAAAHVWKGHPVIVLHPIDPTSSLGRPRERRNTDWARAAAEAEELLDVMETRTFAELRAEESSSLGRAVAALRGGLP